MTGSASTRTARSSRFGWTTRPTRRRRTSTSAPGRRPTGRPSASRSNINPTAPTTFGDQWGQGKLMTTTAWEIGDNSPYIYAGWVVPVANSWWAPLTGQGYALRLADPSRCDQTEGHQPVEAAAAVHAGVRRHAAGQDVRQLQNTYDAGRLEPDPMKRTQALWEIFKVHIDEGPFMYGIVANWPGHGAACTRTSATSPPATNSLSAAGPTRGSSRRLRSTTRRPTTGTTRISTPPDVLRPGRARRICGGPVRRRPDRVTCPRRVVTDRVRTITHGWRVAGQRVACTEAALTPARVASATRRLGRRRRRTP